MLFRNNDDVKLSDFRGTFAKLTARPERFNLGVAFPPEPIDVPENYRHCDGKPYWVMPSKSKVKPPKKFCL